MSTTAFDPLMPRKSKTTTPISMVISTDATGVATRISVLGDDRFSSRMRSVSLLRLGGRCPRPAVNAAHQQADLLDVDAADRHRCREPALVDHRQRVAERQQLVEV